MCGLRDISRALFTAEKEVQDTSCRLGVSPNVGNMTASLLNGLCIRCPGHSFTMRIEGTNVALWVEGAEGAILYSLM